MSKVFTILLLIMLAAVAVQAQNSADSIVISKDSLSSKAAKMNGRRVISTDTVKVVTPVSKTASVTDTVKKPFQPNPKKAGLYAALVPGLGQVYNRQYWKLPIVYAGAAAATYFIIYNNTKYQTYRKAYIGRLNNPSPSDAYVGIYTTENLKTLQDGYKQYSDMTVLISVAAYGIQIIDAISSAHLRNFDISPDISMKVMPVVTPFGGLGVGWVVNF